MTETTTYTETLAAIDALVLDLNEQERVLVGMIERAIATQARTHYPDAYVLDIEDWADEAGSWIVATELRDEAGAVLWNRDASDEAAVAFETAVEAIIWHLDRDTTTYRAHDTEFLIGDYIFGEGN